MKLLLSGMLAMSYLVAGLFFLRYWKVSRDRLFAFFAAAFALFAANRLALGAMGMPQESLHLIYLLRLGGFAVLIGGIIDKNRRAAPSGRA